MENQDRVQFLRSLTAFDDLPEADLLSLAQRVTRSRLPRGALLAREGEVSDTCFQLVSGIIHQTRARTTDDRIAAFLTGGEVVGDRSLRTGQPETVTAVAFTDVELLALPRREFEEMLRERPAMALALVRALATRLERAGGAVAPAASTPAAPALQGASARIIPLVAAAAGSGRTTLGVSLCTAIAEVSGGRVLLMDPSMTGKGIAKSLGISSDADYAETLLKGGALDVERATWKTKGGFWTLLPPRRRGASLAEPHLLAAFDALARAFDFVVVDSSSVLASVNRAVLKAADRILLVSRAGEPRADADLQQFQRSVLAAGEVKPERLVCALNRADGAAAPPGDWLPVPQAPELLEACDRDRAIPYQADPASPFARAVLELARRLVFDHRLRIALPAHRWATEQQPEETAVRLRAFLGSRFAQVALESAVAAGPEPSPFAVQAWATQPVLSRHLEETVNFLGTIKGELALPYLCLEINGKPNLI